MIYVVKLTVIKRKFISGFAIGVNSEAFGTGFPATLGGKSIASADRVIITNSHCIIGAVRVFAEYDGKSYELTIYDDIPEYDIAFLSCPDIPTNRIEARFTPGMNINIWGYPSQGNNPCVTRGVINRIEPGEYYASDTHLVLQSDAPITPGSSGSPVANDDSAVIGIAFSHDTRFTARSFIIPAYYILMLIDRYPYRGKVGSPISVIGFNDHIRVIDAPPDFPVKIDDVITHINGVVINERGMIRIGGDYVPSNSGAYFVPYDFILESGARFEYTIMRAGRQIAIPIQPGIAVSYCASGMKNINNECICVGGLVFRELSHQIMYDIPEYNVRPEPSSVILVEILKTKSTMQYKHEPSKSFLMEVNNIPIKSLSHLKQVVIDFTRKTGDQSGSASKVEFIFKFNCKRTIIIPYSIEMHHYQNIEYL